MDRDGLTLLDALGGCKDAALALALLAATVDKAKHAAKRAA
jgi:hypothetical protein